MVALNVKTQLLDQQEMTIGLNGGHLFVSSG